MLLKLASVFAFVVAAFAAPSFDDWTLAHGKKYTSTERDYRNGVYDTHVATIEAHNAGNHGWTMAVNKFADLTGDEFAARFTGGYVTPKRSLRKHYGRVHSPKMALPNSVDWEAAGAVTPVKNQGQCGSCWSFSTTGAVEGAWFLSNGTLVSLSEQQLVDCSTAEGNQGCNGGLMDYAFEYIIKNGGITTEAAYPYTGADGKCQAKGKPIAATLTSYVDVPANSETALMTAIVQQPISVAVEADQNSFQFYSSGVMTAACGTNLDHGVLVVGYGTLSSQDYYKVKNSWGADWGMAGYILLGRGTYNGAAGQCGIQSQPSYPVV